MRPLPTFRLAIAILCFPIPSAAQFIGAGVKLGLPLTDSLDLIGSGFRGDRPNLTTGPFVEVRFTDLVAVEFDALRESLRIDYTAASQTATAKAASWQLPLLLKVRLSRGRIRPFLAGGVSAYYLGGVEETGAFLSGASIAIRNSLSRVGNSFINGGGVAGGGVEFKLWRLRIGPELRFTRWIVDKSVGTNDLSLRLTQSQTHLFLTASF